MKLVREHIEFKQGGDPYKKLNIGNNNLPKWMVIATWTEYNEEQWDRIHTYCVTKPEAIAIADHYNSGNHREYARVISEEEYNSLLAEEL